MKKNISKLDILSFIGILLITSGGYFRYSNIANKPIKTIIVASVYIIGAGLLLIEVVKNIIDKKYSKKQIGIVGIIAVAGILVWHRTLEIYLYLIIALNFLNKDLKKLIKYIFISSLIAFSLIIFLYIIKVIPNADRIRPDGRFRYSLGFSQPNVLFRMYLPIVITGAITYKNDKIFLLLTTILGAVLYLYSASKTGIIILIILTFINLLPSKLKKKISFPKYIPYIFVACLLFSITLALTCHNNDTVNKILSYRPYHWYAYLKEISFLGRTTGIPTLVVDNLFLNILIFGGVYGLLYYLALYFFSFNKTDNKGNYNLFIIFIISFIYGLSENFSSQGESFILLLLMIQLLDKEKLKEIDNDYVNEKSSFC